MKNAVLYNGMWLSKKSYAYELFTLKEFEKLDKHLKQVEENYRKLTYGR